MPASILKFFPKTFFSASNVKHPASTSKEFSIPDDFEEPLYLGNKYVVVLPQIIAGYAKEITIWFSKDVNPEVIDLRTLVPLDKKTILSSVKKTGKIVIIDEARDTCSAASHISAIVVDEGFQYLKAPIRRVTVPDTPMPYAPNSEKYLIPSVERIYKTVMTLNKSY